ncbi:peptidase T [Atopobiaceae bacterium 24-176]
MKALDAETVMASPDTSDVLRRFLRYVQVDSPSDPDHEERVPSDPSEHAMAELLAEELRALGADDVTVDEHAYATAFVPASPGSEDKPCLGLIAHIDTAHDAPNRGVRPQVVAYEGGDLVISPDVRVTPQAVDDLPSLAGQAVVTSDGTTLLSADDKAGVAEIMALVARLLADPSLPHPPLAVAFVPDEEIGHGAALLDIDAFGAAYAYTVDGEELGQLNYECFSAASVEVSFTGEGVHPGDAKDRMVNAISLFEEFDAMLPAAERPEHTAGYEGYFHCHDVSGTVDECRASYLVRDFDAASFEGRLDLMAAAASYIEGRYGKGRVSLDVKREYRNMAERLEGSEFLVDRAKAAMEACGVTPLCVPARGGTDGAQLTFRGLPCPNLATGGRLAHSVREFVPVPALEVTVDILEKLVASFA